MNYVSAIGFFHKLRKFADPSNTFYFRKLLQGIRNRGAKGRPLLPINICLLENLLQFIPRITRTVFDTILMKAVFLCMYNGCLRIGESVIADTRNNHTLKVENIKFRYKNGQIVSFWMKLDTYKHHNDSSCWLVINSISQENTCPLLVLYKYWSIRPKKSGIFFIWYDGQPLFRSDYVKCLKEF